MFGTAGTNWHKHVAIGSYILIVLTIVLIVLGILTFTHPPDPAHPMSLDLLSKSLTISPWMALTVGLGLVAITTFIVRRRIYGSLPIASLVTENDQLKKQIADLYSQNAALRSRAESARKEPVKRSAMFYGGGSPAAKLPSFDNQDPILEFRWHEGLAIEIDSRSNSGPLFISAINNTPDYMLSLIHI